MPPRTIFVTGGTGYLGRPLITALLSRGHAVKALVRAGSEPRVPRGAEVVLGNALDAETFAGAVSPADTFVHLIGTPHPSPGKAQEFRDVDLVSVQAAVRAATEGGVRHFVYLSVAQPAPIMQAYIAVRREGEALIRMSGMSATFLRPWYVLGPGHRWMYGFLPVYALLRLVAATREMANRLGTVTLRQMIRALVDAVEHPPQGIRELNVKEIRQ